MTTFSSIYLHRPYELSHDERTALRLWCKYRALTETFDRELARSHGVPDASCDPDLLRLSGRHARRVAGETIDHLDRDLSRWAQRLSGGWSYERQLQHLEECNE